MMQENSWHVEHFRNWLQKQEDVQKLWVESRMLIATELCYVQSYK